MSTKPSLHDFDPSAFVVIGLLAALVRAALMPVEIIGSAVAYGVAGFSCGWVLRTRVSEVARRVLVVAVCTATFVVCGVWVEYLPFVVEVDLRMGWAALAWGCVGAVVGIAFLSWGRSLAAPVFSAVAFGVAGAMTQGVVAFETPWDPAPATLLGLVLITGISGTLFDYSCARLGLDSPSRGLDRLRLERKVD